MYHARGSERVDYSASHIVPRMRHGFRTVLGRLRDHTPRSAEHPSKVRIDYVSAKH